jgi:hypothetical protein
MNNVSNVRKNIILNIIFLIVLIFIIILVNYIFQDFFNKIIYDRGVYSIIEGADGPVTIYTPYSLINILRYLLSIFIIMNIIILLVYDIIELIGSKKYSIKYKFKIIFVIDLIVILSTLVEIIFFLLSTTISIIFNIILISILLIKIYFVRIIAQKNDEIKSVDK